MTIILPLLLKAILGFCINAVIGMVQGRIDLSVIRYLLRGEEDDDGMNLSKCEQELIRLYRYLHADSKEKLMATAEVLVNLGRSTTNKNQKEKSEE